MKKNTAVTPQKPCSPKVIHHLAPILKPSFRTFLFLFAAGMFLFSCEEDEIPRSSEASITSLTLTVGTTDYEITFTNNKGKITVPYSTNLSDGAVVKVVTLSTKATGVKVGDNVTISATGIITLTVTAEDKTTTQEYTVTVEKAPASSDASITTLTLTVGSSDHEINFTDRAYTLILPAGSTLPTAVGVKKIALSAGATGVADNDELTVTNTTVTITVTAEDGKTTQEYTVTLSVAASVGASITALTLTVGDSDYEVMFQGTRGMVMVPYDTEIPAQIRVKAIALFDGATSDAKNGNELGVTDNTVTLTVTAEDGTTESVYTVTFSVALSSEASINTLTFTLEDKDYEIMFEDRQGTMTIPYSTEIPTKVRVKQIALSDGATSNTDNGNELSVTDNAVTITVTAEDGKTTQEYTVTVEKAPASNEALITDLTLTVTDTDYEVTFMGTRDTLRVIPLGTSVPATVGVKEIALSAGATSDAGNELRVTDNTVTLTVTAENGTTTNTYAVVLDFTTVGITSFTFEVTDNESMALDEDDRKRIVGKINQEDKTITFDEQSAYVYLDKLKATFEVSEEGAAVQVAGADQESGVTEQDFSSAVSYVVRAAGGTETTTYTVTLLKSTLATIPDDKFRARLKGFVPAAFTGDQLDITHRDVTNHSIMSIENQRPMLISLKGIEFFTALTSLKCSYNALTSLDMSKNTALTFLRCLDNSLTSLDVSANTALDTLNCGNNDLMSLDVSANMALTYLDCGDNGLSSLDASGKMALAVLECYGNSLTSLDVRGSTALTFLRCLDNSLASLDVRENTALTYLNCSENDLTTLDVTENTALVGLNCSDNGLSSLDTSGKMALKRLYCNDNSFTSLDVRENTALEVLNCINNDLTSLDVSKNTALTILACSGNGLTSLDLSKNTVLTLLYCNENSLTSLDMTGMRSVEVDGLNIGTGTGTDSEPDNHLLATLRVNTALQDRTEIITMKTARGADLTITTVNDEGEEQCANYAPDQDGGTCN